MGVQRSHPDKINAGVKAKSIKVFGFRKSRELIKRCQAQLSAKTKKNCGTWRSNVGSRRLPCSELEYKARAPEKQASNGKNGIFKTVWLPVNASNRVVNDRQQDIMHMKYSGQLEKAISRKDKKTRSPEPHYQLHTNSHEGHYQKSSSNQSK